MTILQKFLFSSVVCSSVSLTFQPVSFPAPNIRLQYRAPSGSQLHRAIREYFICQFHAYLEAAFCASVSTHRVYLVPPLVFLSPRHSNRPICDPVADPFPSYGRAIYSWARLGHLLLDSLNRMSIGLPRPWDTRAYSRDILFTSCLPSESREALVGRALSSGMQWQE